MKILTANFVTCAVKACKSSPESFPLHFRDAELEQTDMEFNPTFLRNILPRIEWDALRTTAEEVCVKPFFHASSTLLKVCIARIYYAPPDEARGQRVGRSRGGRPTSR